MRWGNRRLRAVFVGLGLAVALGAPLALAQQVHRNRFEGHAVSWTKGEADVAFDEIAHVMSDQGSHEGQRSELIQINAKQQGSHIHYVYPVGKAPIADDLSVSLWVKSQRPGVQLLARVVLPKESDPGSIDQRLTTLIRGDTYRVAGRWQRLELGRPVALARQQQQLMQAQLKRQINFDGAYIDTLILNVYTGVGSTDVFIDDLEIGPVAEIPPLPRATADLKQGPQRPERIAPEVENSGSNLLVGGKKVFPRIIRHTDTPPAALRNAGFDTLFVEHNADPALLRQAVELGFWLVPNLPVKTDPNYLTSTESYCQEVRDFPERDAVLFWNLCNAGPFEQAANVARTALLVRQTDRQRPLGGDVWDGLPRYSNSLNLVAIHRWPLMTTLEMSQYKEWLETRGRLANPGTFLWTWVQTHTPEWYAQLLYEQSAQNSFKAPVGPQPEQIRLLTYTALASGCRGLGFWSDRFLADSHYGRDRLLCLAQINQEIDMLEPFLVSQAADSPPLWIDTSSKDVKAAVMRTGKGVLVLPIWQGSGAQFVPGQSAVAKLSITVPQVPQSCQAYEVLPGEVRALSPQRVAGGTKVTLREFGLTSAIVFTSDLQLIVHLQDQCRAKQKLAAQFKYDQAVLEMEKVKTIQEALDRTHQGVPDAAGLLHDAYDRLTKAKREWDERLYADSYRESERALRPLLILMRAQWEKATKELDSPVSSPYAVSYFTLPRHVQLMDQVAHLRPAANLLPGGDFETDKEMTQLQWGAQDTTLDDVFMSAQRVTENVKEGRQCLRLQIRPKNKDLPPPKVLERSFLAINSPGIRLPVGSLVKVSGWVMIPDPITASPDGALFYDSAGGEPLALRLRDKTPWKQFTFYRRVPATGTINITVALTGLGSVYFDDLRIEPLVAPN